MQRSARNLLSSGLLIVSSIAGCAKPPAVPNQPTKTVALHQGPLSDLVPSAGLRWLLVVKPRKILAAPGVAKAIERLFPSKRLDVFEENSGVDLRELPSACIASYDLGTIYLAQAPASIGKAQQAFVDRLVSDPLFRRPGPGVVQVTGIIGLTPESFVALEGIGFGVAVKDPLLAKIAGAYALGKLKRSPSAFSGAALRELPKTLKDAPLGFFAPGPFQDEWAQGAHGLLAQTVSVAVVAKPNRDATLTIEATMVGDYGDDLTKVNQLAQQSLLNLSQSGLGKVLGLGDETVAPEVTAQRTQVEVRVAMPLERLMAGLHAAVAADALELLEMKQPTRPIAH